MINKCLATAFVLFVFIFWHNVIFGMDWITANQVTLAWEPVTTCLDGSPFPEGDKISYEVFIILEGDQKPSGMVLCIETTKTETTLSFDLEGRFFVGVRAVRLRAGQPVSRSIVSWSDNPDIMMDGLTQGVIFFRQPLNPLDLDIK